jgi:two-component system, LytTR family, sensor kinase
MNKTAGRHIIFWVVFLSWDIIQVAFSLGSLAETPWKMIAIPAYSGVLDMLMKAVLFYALYYWVYKPAVNGSTRLYITVMVTVLLVFVSLLLQRTLMYYLVMPQLWGQGGYKVSFFRFYSMVVTLFDMLVPVCMLFMYELYNDAKRRREREAALEKEKLQSELRFLKAQINPHLLFNVLGTIHALTLHQAPKAADVTIRLSKIMRFMLYEAGCDRITLAGEIKMLEDYMALENIRFASKLDISFIKEVPDESLQIAPLILLPFVENAFKHGTAESQFISAIVIKLAVRDKALFFEVHNSVEPGNTREKEHGIGLANVRRRLELLYPDHKLRIVPAEKKFSVYLNFEVN